MKSFQLNIITPEKIAVEYPVVSVILPGSDGYLGVWANHAPLVSGVEPGVVAVRHDSGDVIYLSVSQGFAEISNNTVNIMCDTCEEAKEIDLERAQASLQRAVERIRIRKIGDDMERAREALARAEARLQVIKKERHR